MNDDTTSTDQARYGRKIRPCAFGDTADEIEMAALDQARQVFGPHTQLEVNRNYEILG